MSYTGGRTLYANTKEFLTSKQAPTPRALRNPPALHRDTAPPLPYQFLHQPSQGYGGGPAVPDFANSFGGNWQQVYPSQSCDPDPAAKGLDVAGTYGNNAEELATVWNGWGGSGKINSRNDDSQYYRMGDSNASGAEQHPSIMPGELPFGSRAQEGAGYAVSGNGTNGYASAGLGANGEYGVRLQTGYSQTMGYAQQHASDFEGLPSGTSPEQQFSISMLLRSGRTSGEAGGTEHVQSSAQQGYGQQGQHASWGATGQATGYAGLVRRPGLQGPTALKFAAETRVVEARAQLSANRPSTFPNHTAPEIKYPAIEPSASAAPEHTFNVVDLCDQESPIVADSAEGHDNELSLHREPHDVAKNAQGATSAKSMEEALQIASRSVELDRSPVSGFSPGLNWAPGEGLNRISGDSKGNFSNPGGDDIKSPPLVSNEVDEEFKSEHVVEVDPPRLYNSQSNVTKEMISPRATQQAHSNGETLAAADGKREKLLRNGTPPTSAAKPRTHPTHEEPAKNQLSPIVLSPDADLPHQCTQKSMQSFPLPSTTVEDTKHVENELKTGKHLDNYLLDGSAQSDEDVDCNDIPLGALPQPKGKGQDSPKIPRRRRVPQRLFNSDDEDEDFAPSTAAHKVKIEKRRRAKSASQEPKVNQKGGRRHLRLMFGSDDEDEDNECPSSGTAVLKETNDHSSKEVSAPRAAASTADCGRSSSSRVVGRRKGGKATNILDEDENPPRRSSRRKKSNLDKQFMESELEEDNSDDDFEESRGRPSRSRGKRTSKRSRNESPSTKTKVQLSRKSRRNQNLVNLVENPSEGGGSQGMQITVKALPPSKKRKKQQYPDHLRKKLSLDELSTLRLAFVEFYPPPPSNLQAQGRYEQMYGKEMSKEMITGLWRKELKPWSERWWEFYGLFNEAARQKKSEKSPEKNPTITDKEAKIWAKEFHEEHGDARISALSEEANAGAEKNSTGRELKAGSSPGSTSGSPGGSSLGSPNQGSQSN